MKNVPSKCASEESTPAANRRSKKAWDYEEELAVEKKPKVTGEIEVKKHPVTEEKEVRGTVRKEVPHVEKRTHDEGGPRHTRH